MYTYIHTCIYIFIRTYAYISHIHLYMDTYACALGHKSYTNPAAQLLIKLLSACALGHKP